MDALSDERGQVALLAAGVVAVAAVVIAGLRGAQDRLVAVAVERRAGEAAVAAATAVVADAYVADLATAVPDVPRAMAGPRLREAARVAASAMSLANGGPPVDAVRVRCASGAVEVALTIRGSAYRAGFGAPECSPP